MVGGMTTNGPNLKHHSISSQYYTCKKCCKAVTFYRRKVSISSGVSFKTLDLSPLGDQVLLRPTAHPKIRAQYDFFATWICDMWPSVIMTKCWYMQWLTTHCIGDQWVPPPSLEIHGRQRDAALSRNVFRIIFRRCMMQRSAQLAWLPTRWIGVKSQHVYIKVSWSGLGPRTLVKLSSQGMCAYRSFYNLRCCEPTYSETAVNKSSYV